MDILEVCLCIVAFLRFDQVVAWATFRTGHVRVMMDQAVALLTWVFVDLLR